MALLRIKSLEQIRYWDAGEFGKLIGLDRIPEVKTLRTKIDHLAEHGNVADWGKELSKYWMAQNETLAGTLYVDGHVRVYHGEQTKLPKRFVSREKLCLRGVTDYWVNDCLGQPFFVVSKEVNEGLLSVLEGSIIKQLLNDVPNQPTKELLENNKFLPRFNIVFDREGYSPKFLKKQWENHIACITYKKSVSDSWSEEEFISTEVTHPNGEKDVMLLAERGIYNKTEKFWIREIRKLSGNKQTTIVTTNYHLSAAIIAVTMFARWSQENFFKYMIEHYGIDRLAGNKLESINETQSIVNPIYRQVDSEIRSLTSKLNRKKAEYATVILDEDIEEKQVKAYIITKAKLVDIISELEQEIQNKKTKRSDTPRKIAISELPESEKFKAFKKTKKQFVDTIKMIAYRAETAMASIVAPLLSNQDEKRSIIRQILATDADIIPQINTKTLLIKLHNLTNPRNNSYVRNLCQILNESEIVFPGTDLRLVFDSVSMNSAPCQDV